MVATEVRGHGEIRKKSGARQGGRRMGMSGEGNEGEEEGWWLFEVEVSWCVVKVTKG